MSEEKFQPTWESLTQYKTPDWFRDAKFGIWAHWGPQCQPARGDWYARGMYLEDHEQHEQHLALYGDPSEFGFKDVIHEWKAEKWDPEKLVALYKRVGAEYFVALANHHDNMDLWDSTHQPWNSTAVGPEKNIIAGWAEAAKNQVFDSGVSVHASHAWSWYEPAQAYDGKLTKADGQGKWWDGLDPQDLYAQDHEPAPSAREQYSVIKFWEWGNGYEPPSEEYCEKFYNRTVELTEKYKPDLVYFDDTVFPLWPVSDVGLRFAAYFYNANSSWHGGDNQAVVNGKVLDEQQRRAMVWDIERGQSDAIEPLPWQCDTCLGDWHYRQSTYDDHGYKSAKTVIHTLADVVSKNGNLLLSVPLKGDGALDDQEEAILEGIAEWMAINKEAIVGTRPWKVSGEGPASASAKPLEAQGFNEGTGKPFTAEDVRFTTKGDALYAIVLGKPAATVSIASLGEARGLIDRRIARISVLGSSEDVSFEFGKEALNLQTAAVEGNEIATVFRLALD